MEDDPLVMAATRHPLISSWTSTPIPNLSLSAGGLLALADLNTVAQRTAIKGGSSWLDALVLAPGLHYQQAADALEQESVPGLAAELGLTAAIETKADGTELRRYVISNIAMVNYLKRLWSSNEKGGVITLNVGMAREGEEMEQMAKRLSAKLYRQGVGTSDWNQPVELDWLSHVLYLMSPLLTVSAVTFMILLADWWGCAFIIALMVSRILNIWTIKQRGKQAKKPSPKDLSAAAALDNHPTEYTIDLGENRRVILRGLNSDLQAVTTQTWLRSKSTFDGYLEAVSKLIVYLVAAFSGNLTQAGGLVLMSLLLSSAGLLGLSNAHVRGLQMHGRVARPERDRRDDDDAKSESTDIEQGRVTGFPVENFRARRTSGM